MSRYPNNTNLITPIKGVIAEAYDIYSALFDGIDEGLNGGDILDYQVSGGAEEISCSFWFKSSSISTGQLVIAKRNAPTYTQGWCVYLESSKIHFQILGTAPGSQQLIGFYNTELENDTWYHICITFNGVASISGMKFYLNGSLVTTTQLIDTLTSFADSSTTADFTIGFDSNGGFPFVGNIDSASFWDKVLDVSEVSELYNNGVPGDVSEHSVFNTNCRAWYPIGILGDSTGGGGTIQDLGPSGTLDLTPINMEAGDLVEDVP